MPSFIQRFKALSPQVVLYFLAVGFMGASLGCFHTTYNNYLDDIFRIDAATRGALEFPREFPGFMVAVMAGLLAFLAESRVAAFSALTVFVGMMLLGFVDTLAATPTFAAVESRTPSLWILMLVGTILWSAGDHLIIPVRSSIALSLAKRERFGRRLGQTSGVGAAATIFGAFIALMVSRFTVPTRFWMIFTSGAFLSLGAAITFFKMKNIGIQTTRPRIIFRWRYWIFYALSMLFGARKQVFLTFAPWVLIQVFGRNVSTFAKLYMVNSALTVFTNPFIGTLIDRYGERRMLMLDALFMMVITFTYGLARLMGPWGLWIAYTCFIFDYVLFGMGNARATYLAKIAEKPEHVTPTLGMGVTLDHAVSMSLPFVGGLVWERYGHSWVFFGAAAIAMITFFISACIRMQKSPEDTQGAVRANI